MNIFFYKSWAYEDLVSNYILIKIALYALVTFCIFIGVGSSLPFKAFALCSVFTDIIVLSAGWNRLINYFEQSRFLKIILIIICLTLYTYPISFDDVAYGLVLPKIIFEQRSFTPVYQYTIFTYFPLIEFSRSILSFAFGSFPQLFIYRLECLTIFILSLVCIFKIAEAGLKTSIALNKNLPFIVLAIFSTMSAFSVFSFTKPESFIYLCFLIGTYYLLVGNSIGAICYAIVSMTFKATAIFTSSPVLIFAILSLKGRVGKIKLGEIYAVILALIVAILWLLNTYKFTGDPTYPFLQSLFPYTSDGALNSLQYNNFVDLLKAQRDVSIRNFYSVKLYFKNILTQLNFLFPFLLFGMYCIFSGKVKSIATLKFSKYSILVLVFFIIFLYSLFNEFRYAYGPVTIMVLIALVSIASMNRRLVVSNFKYFMIVVIILQLSFVTARNIKNSTFDLSKTMFPINLATEQTDEIKCIRSFTNSDAKVATFDQNFYLWDRPFYLLHELNEYIGMSPSPQQILYAFDKHNVKFVLLRNEYLQQSHLETLDFGGNYREMPNNVMKSINEAYALEAIELPLCSKHTIFKLVARN